MAAASPRRRGHAKPASPQPPISLASRHVGAGADAGCADGDRHALAAIEKIDEILLGARAHGGEFQEQVVAAALAAGAEMTDRKTANAARIGEHNGLAEFLARDG